MVHLRKVHGYKNPMKGGGNAKVKKAAAAAAKIGLMKGPVCCQTFLTGGGYIRYFIVTSEAEASTEALAPPAARREQDQDQPTTDDLRQHFRADPGCSRGHILDIYKGRRTCMVDRISSRMRPWVGHGEDKAWARVGLGLKVD